MQAAPGEHDCPARPDDPAAAPEPALLLSSSSAPRSVRVAVGSMGAGDEAGRCVAGSMLFPVPEEEVHRQQDCYQADDGHADVPDGVGTAVTDLQDLEAP